MKELLNEWRNFLLEAEAEYSGILKVSLTPEAVKKVEELQNQIIRKGFCETIHIEKCSFLL